MSTNFTRRQFIASALATGAAAGPLFAATQAPAGPRRIGTVAYSFYYSIGLFHYRKRAGDRMDALQFVESTRRCGGDVAQFYYSMLTSLSDDELKRVRRRAEELEVRLEVHGGNALRAGSEAALEPAGALGCRVLGYNFGMLMRPGKIDTLEAWDEHLRRCRVRLAELVGPAKALGLTLALENHLDFTVEELRDLVVGAQSDHVGVLFDVGNMVGTLDEPVEAAELLGPYTVATHFKDFAIEETERGFRFTMVPLGSGSLRLPEITRTLLKHVRPEVNFVIEMINGQQLEIDWLEDRFWTAYRNKTPRQVAATLRHIRSKRFDEKERIPVEDFEKLPYDKHVATEHERLKRCVSYLRGIVE